MSHIFLTGATGFVGNELRPLLLRNRYKLTVVTRSPDKYRSEEASNQQFISWDDDWGAELAKSDAVINLSGEPLFGQRWTSNVKKRIYDSRVLTTRNLVNKMGEIDDPPSVLVSASGVGYYGDTGDQWIGEQLDPGDDFLADVCKDWENEARQAELYGVRVVNPRIGIALEYDGGALAQMKLPFNLMGGGPIGSGQQYMPWIHRTDLCRSIHFSLENSNLQGPYNASAPEPVTMNEFAKALGKAMGRPSWFKVPEFALKMALGEAAQPVLQSNRAYPYKLLNEGFSFEYEDVKLALNDIMQK